MRYNILFKGYVEIKYTQDKTLIQFHLSKNVRYNKITYPGTGSGNFPSAISKQLKIF